MTEGGVIPRPGERSGLPREIGRMQDVDGVPIIFSLNRDGTARITIGGYLSLPGHGSGDFDVAKADEFTRLWFEVLREAGEEAAEDDDVVDATIHAADCMNPDCRGVCDAGNATCPCGKPITHTEFCYGGDVKPP